MILGETLKMKVYELSRELKLKDSELLEIIAKLELDANSKFSSLKYADVEKIKAYCRENRGPVVVEKRVGAGIVRRRAKGRRKAEAASAVPESLSESSPTPHAAVPKASHLAAPEAEPAVPVAATSAAGEPRSPVEEAITKGETVSPLPAESVAFPSPVAEGIAAPETGAAITAATVPPAAVETEAETAETPSKAAIESPAVPEQGASVSAEPEAPTAGAVAGEAEDAEGGEKTRGARVIGRVELDQLQQERPATGGIPGRRPTLGRPAPADVGAIPPQDVGAEGRRSRKGRKKGAAADEGSDRRRKQGHKKSVIKDLSMLEAESGRRGKGRKGKSGKRAQSTEITMPKEIKRVVRISDVISVGDLAKRLGVKAGEMIAKLMNLGVMATINQMIDLDTASLIAAEYGHTVENVAFDEQAVLAGEIGTEDSDENLCPRPPVVTVMGHVDHGKTSLLDAIRKARVADKEAGGITQHIGAYFVDTARGRISFVDTPGHEAFTSMRSRGASITDIVILVVAADDGVMPQTVESINHARAAEVPIIVAVNKIDKPNARPDEVKRQLSERGLMPEDWGGDTIFVDVSAKQGTNIDTLLEMVLLQAEMMELKANPDKPARGIIIESRLDKGMGPVATVLVKEGTLSRGDYVVAGLYHGRVRALINDLGEQVEAAGPSIPVEVLGLSGVPDAGDDFNVVKSEKVARELADHRQHKFREREISKTSKISLDDLFDRIQEGEVEQLNVIVKADVQGSVEAVAESLRKLSTDKVKVEIIHAAVGGIKEADVMLGSASNAIIIGFNVRPDTKAQGIAEQEGVDIRTYSIIYDLIEDVKKAMAGLLQPEIREVYLGRAEVLETFTISKLGTIAGCKVMDGKLNRNARVRLLRDDVVIFDGHLSSLKRFKDDVKEVAAGYECGVGIEKFNDIKPGDSIEAYTTEEVAATL